MGAGGYSSDGFGSYLRVGVSVFLLALINNAALAQSVAPAPALPALSVPGSITEPPPDLLDGTLSGLGDELDDDSPKSSWLRFPSALQPPEYFRRLELGWSGTAATAVPIQARGPMDANNFSVTLWDKDAGQNGPAAAHGVAFNANYLVQDNVMLFGRGGWSEGWQLDRNPNLGLGWRPNQEYSDLFGIGGGWAQPANPNLRDQYIFEAFYRFRLTPQLAITPDVQWILHPTLSPNTGSIWVASLLARITF